MSVKNFFYSCFPVPELLRVTAAGLDISDQSAKFVLIKDSRGRLQLDRFGSVDIPVGTIEAGRIKDKKALAEALKILHEQHGLTEVNLSLPEELAYLVRMKLPLANRDDLRSSIELQLEEYIPLPATDVIFDYEILPIVDPKKTTCEVAVSIFPKDVAIDYYDAVTEAGLSVASAEIEAQSVSRAMIKPHDLNTYMIIDLGKTRSGFSIVTQGSVVFTSTVSNVGGDRITGMIAKNLNISQQEAEELKISKGMSLSPSNRELFQSVIPVVSILKDEIARHYNYWQEHRENSLPGSSISSLILCGGQCTLPGLKEYLRLNINTPTEIGNPWVNIVDTHNEVPPIDFRNSLRYSSAIGLALRGRLK